MFIFFLFGMGLGLLMWVRNETKYLKRKLYSKKSNTLTKMDPIR